MKFGEKQVSIYQQALGVNGHDHGYGPDRDCAHVHDDGVHVRDHAHDRRDCAAKANAGSNARTRHRAVHLTRSSAALSAATPVPRAPCPRG